MRHVTQKLLKVLSCFVLIGAMSVIAFAQFKAGLQGTVMDASGAVIAGASITLINVDTNQQMKVTSSADGYYRFSGLGPGNYRITVEKEGFKKRVVEKVAISAEALNGLDILMDAGVISETVTVQAGETRLETEDATVRKTITAEEVTTLPQAGRDPYELVRLTPGVFGLGSRSASGASSNLPNTSGPGGSNNSIFATENRQPISANGQRVSANNFQIDGTSVNSQTWGGAAVITPSQESISEISVKSSTYTAEDGRNSGAQVNVVSKTGLNEWHGSGFFKINDPSLNAFNTMPARIGTFNTSGPQRVGRKFNSFGGSFGGAIIQDKLFFFATYEGMREKTTNTYTSLIETSSFRQAIISGRPNTLSARIMNSAGITPRVVGTLTPTCDGIFVPCTVVGNGMDIGSLSGAYGSYVRFDNPTVRDGIADVQWATLPSLFEFKGNQFNTRLDYDLNEKDRITFSTFIVPFKQTSSDNNAQSRPQADITSERLNYAFTGIYRRNISASILNEARVSITRWGFDETESNPGADLGLPRVEIEGFWSNRLRFGFPSGLNTPGVIDEKQIDFRNALTVVSGNKTWKFGAEYRRDLNSNGEVGGARPLYSFHRPWNFANGTPIFEFLAAKFDGTPSANNTKFATSELAFFAQNDWMITPSVTVNLGLRWSYFSPIAASDGQLLGNLVTDSNGGLAGAKISTAKNLYKKDWTNFAPQLGFAWNPRFMGQKFVIRGGGGMGYERLPNALLANARRNPPNGALFGICCGSDTGEFGSPFVGGLITYVASGNGQITGYPRNPLLGGGLNPTNGLPNSGRVEIFGAPQDLPSAYVMRYSVQGQYELSRGLIATLGYSGSQGRHFVRILPLHIMAPTTNPAINAAFFASPDVNTSYNAMLARLQGKIGRQLTFDTNYRWGKSIDTSSFEAPCACTNQSFPVDQKEERGPSDFDVTHSLVSQATWEIPSFDNPWGKELVSGWRISGITTWSGGFPWTPKLFGCLLGPNPNNFCDPRPTSFLGGTPLSNSNENFLSARGIFPGGGARYFSTSVPFNAPAFSQRPGIGRNRFRGPRYFSLDLSVAKKIDLSAIDFLGEKANVDVRFNFFNVLNNLNLAPFNSNSDPTRVTLTQFGTATSALAGRVGEFQIRFSF